MKLKAMLREQAARKQQVSTGYTEISGEETVESTSVAINGSHKHPIADCNYLFNVVEEYNPAVSPPAYWGAMPSYPQ